MPALAPGIGEPERVVAVAACDVFVIAATSHGRVHTWGWPQVCLGRGGDQHVPGRLQGLGGEHVTLVAAGNKLALAATSTGAAYSWGTGPGVGLGSSRLGDVHRPRRIQALVRERVVLLDAGHKGHAMAATASGDVWAWGTGEGFKLGHGHEHDVTVPTQLARHAGYGPKDGPVPWAPSAIAAGYDFSCATCEDAGTELLWTWGSGEEGQLADERMCDGEAHHGDFEALTRSPGVRQLKVVVHHAGIRVVGVG